MDARTYLQQQFSEVHGYANAVLNDLTDELLNWSPPGTIGPISGILVHLLATEDFFIQKVVQGKARLWDEQGWGEKTGVAHTPDYGESWEVFRTMKLSTANLAEYKQVIFPATEACLAGLSDADLDRLVKFGEGVHPVGDVLALLAVHTASHAGEIAAVKGIQDVKGLPF